MPLFIVQKIRLVALNKPIDNAIAGYVGTCIIFIQLSCNMKGLIMALQLLAIASDIAGGRRGSAKGVELLCKYLIDNQLMNIKAQHCIFPNLDELKNHTLHARAKYITFLYDFYKSFMPDLENMISRGHFPIILSGDHASALACVQAIQNVKAHERVGIVWIDAHADIHTPLSTPSGNVHGMPLAALIGQIPEHTMFYDEYSMWGKISKLSSSSIIPTDIVYCGLRSFEDAEYELIHKHNIYVASVNYLRKNMDACMEHIQKQLRFCQYVYLSVDVDVLDSGLFHSTGCNVPHGLTLHELQELTCLIIDRFKEQLIAFELSEFNPTLDASTQSDTVAIQHFLSSIIERLKDKVVL